MTAFFMSHVLYQPHMGLIYLHLGFQHTKKTCTRQKLVNLKCLKKMIEDWIQIWTRSNKNILCTCLTFIYRHTCAHPLTDYIHGLVPFFTIQQHVQRIQIDQHGSSSNTFKVLILYMPLHLHALLFHDQSKKKSNNVQCLIFYEDNTTNRMIVKIWIELHIHMTISSVEHIWSHGLSMNHIVYQNNVIHNEYHVYIHHLYKSDIL